VRPAKDNSKFNSFSALPPLSLSLSLSLSLCHPLGRGGVEQRHCAPCCISRGMGIIRLLGAHVAPQVSTRGHQEAEAKEEEQGEERRKECVGGMCGRGFRWIQVTSRWRPMMLARARARLQVTLDPSPFLCPFQLPAIFRRAAAWNPLECVVRGVQLCPRVISSRTCATERQECWRVSRDGRPKVVSCLLENIIA